MPERKLDELATTIDDAETMVEELQNDPSTDVNEKLEELHETLDEASDTIDELENNE